MSETKTKSKFTFYWRTGQRDAFEGYGPADALNRAGFGGGAVRALDFYATGEDDEWAWVPETREWVAKVKAT